MGSSCSIVTLVKAKELLVTTTMPSNEQNKANGGKLEMRGHLEFFRSTLVAVAVADVAVVAAADGAK